MSKYSAEEVWDMFKDTFYMTNAERLDCFDTTYMGALFSNFTIDGAMSTYNMWKEKQKPKYEIGDILLLDMDDGSCAEENEQLAEWLEELKELREELSKYTEAGYCDGFENGYNKTVDDFTKIVYNGTLHQIGRMIASGEIPKEVYDKYLSNTPIGFMTPIEICRQIIAEQLKE